VDAAQVPAAFPVPTAASEASRVSTAASEASRVSTGASPDSTAASLVPADSTAASAEAESSAPPGATVLQTEQPIGRACHRRAERLNSPSCAMRSLLAPALLLTAIHCGSPQKGAPVDERGARAFAFVGVTVVPCDRE